MRRHETKEVPNTENVTNNTSPEEKKLDDVLRHQSSFEASTAKTEASWQSPYTKNAVFEWARMQQAQENFDSARGTYLRHGIPVESWNKKWEEAKEEATAAFDATPSGKLLSDIDQVISQAKDRFDATPEKESLTNATQATKAAEKKLEATAKWKEYNKYTQAEKSYDFRFLDSIAREMHKEGKNAARQAVQALDEWSRVKSAKQHEKEAQRQVDINPQWKQYNRIAPPARKALAAWRSYQEAALYQYSDDIQKRTTPLRRKYVEAQNEANQAQPKKRSALERMVTSKDTMQKEDKIYSEKLQQVQRAKKALDQMLDLSRKVENLTAWEPDETKQGYTAKKAQWEQYKKGFQAFRKALGDKNVQDASVEDLDKAMEAWKL